MFSGGASLLNVHLDSWEVVLYAYAIKTFFPQASGGTLMIHFVFGAYLHLIQEAIEQESEK
jgi:hypothetical protein